MPMCAVRCATYRSTLTTPVAHCKHEVQNRFGLTHTSPAHGTHSRFVIHRKLGQLNPSNTPPSRPTSSSIHPPSFVVKARASLQHLVAPTSDHPAEIGSRRRLCLYFTLVPFWSDVISRHHARASTPFRHNLDSIRIHFVVDTWPSPSASLQRNHHPII